jgi:hypothetical protein
MTARIRRWASGRFDPAQEAASGQCAQNVVEGLRGDRADALPCFLRDLLRGHVLALRDGRQDGESRGGDAQSAATQRAREFVTIARGHDS